jgi:FkbM family methyltransferase
MLISFSECVDIVSSLHHVRPRRVLHIGAHTGEEAQSYFEMGCESVVWVEANEALIPSLQAHLATVPIKHQIITAALWDENKTLDFKITNNLQSSSLYGLEKHAYFYPDIKVIEERAVRAYRFDSLAGSLGLERFDTEFDFINIDTQGAELAVLRGMGAILGQLSIKSVYLEVNRSELYQGIPLIGELDAFLRAEDFVRVHTVWTDADWGDALYVKQVTKFVR